MMKASVKTGAFVYYDDFVSKMPKRGHAVNDLWVAYCENC